MCTPTSGTWEGADFSHPVHHEISLTSDIAATKAELEAKGAVFFGEINDEAGRHHAGLPGAGQITL